MTDTIAAMIMNNAELECRDALMADYSENGLMMVLSWTSGSRSKEVTLVTMLPPNEVIDGA